MDLARDTRTEPRSDAPGLRALVVERPWVAIGVVLVGAMALVRFGLSGEAVVSAIFAGVLVVLAAIDIERRIVPNRIVVPATAVVLLGNLVVHPDRRLEFIAATVGAGLVLLLPLLVYPAGMGMGDVKLAAFLGAGLGVAVVSAFIVCMLASFLVAVAIVLTRGLAARKTGIPFAPFLALGGLVALFFG